MSRYVLSTATANMKFHEYTQASPGSPHTPVRTVLIRGGANSPSMDSGFGEQSKTDEGVPLWTPSGVITPISDEQAEMLMRNETFKRGVEGGFFKILDKDPGDSHKKVKQITSDMEGRDGAAPLTQATFASKVKISTEKPE